MSVSADDRQRWVLVFVRELLTARQQHCVLCRSVGRYWSFTHHNHHHHNRLRRSVLQTSQPAGRTRSNAQERGGHIHWQRLRGQPVQQATAW